ncbi:hypothetical protein BHM03_00059828 [Ensete ventricosum]|nr:hypothetical protein BHM03_00059828 [Ensete ventricosum]
MFLVDWLYGILWMLGLGAKEAKILFLGLDNAGKTTLLHMLKDEVPYPASFVASFFIVHALFSFFWAGGGDGNEQRLGQHQPTQHPTSEELMIGKIRFTAFDLGGHRMARRLWKDYYTKMDAVVYIVDAADRDRFLESKKELDALLSDEALVDVPFLVLGNKIDIPYAASEDELRYRLGLAGCTTGKGTVSYAGSSIRPVELFMCSIVRKMGYADGFRWLSQYIK